MNFFKCLTGWAWAEILFFIAIIATDTLSDKTGGLWVSLVFVAICSASAIHDEIKYRFDLPVNHPDQVVDERGILANLIRSILCIVMCFASIRLGSAWFSVLGAGLMALASYAVYKSYMLFVFANEDVKYEG